MRSSAAVTRKPLSESSAFMPVKRESSEPTGLPVRGSRIPFGAGATSVMGLSIPFQRPLLPLIYEANGQNAKEHHHRPETVSTDLAEDDRPREQEAHFEIENDEKDGDQVEAHVELHTRIVERIEAGLVGGRLCGIGLLVRDNEGGNQQCEADGKCDRDEYNQRQIIQKQCAHQLPLACSPACLIIRPPRTARRPGRRRFSRTNRPLLVGIPQDGSGRGLAQRTKGGKPTLGGIHERSPPVAGFTSRN